ncbi:MAG: selenocysteine-specific translation elongation factor [Candidatus Marinimicrobia bacterium]|nr:selenocysteine-specific translation elongation factor [Candidatus Neomarinimicrobiota bacterium]
MKSNPVIIGTAGHVDHGKTALVKQLTGTDTDRLDEEKQRKLTIDLGFAFLNDRIAFIDVPGHEKFVENMVAGISTINYGLLVIAANDSVMPQTREHLKIMHSLGIKKGAIVITKIDLVDSEWLDLILQDVKELINNTFLADQQIFFVSSKNGRGIAQLKQHLLSLEGEKLDNIERERFCLPIDRVFSIHGFGTVVTGTVVSGGIECGEKIQVYPALKQGEIRNIQKHEKDARKAIKAERAALNLSGIEKERIKRGNIIARPETFQTSKIITARVYLFRDMEELKYNREIKVNIGTGKYVGRIRFIGKNEIKGGESSIAQIHLHEKIAAGFKDKFVIRSLSPTQTIGGGVVLKMDNRPIRKKETEEAKKLQELYNNSPKEAVHWFIVHAEKGMGVKGLALALTMTKYQVNVVLDELIQEGVIVKTAEKYYCTELVNNYKKRILEIIDHYHQENHLDEGITFNKLISQVDSERNLVEYILKKLIEINRIKELSGDRYALKDFAVTLNTEEKKIAEQIYYLVDSAGREMLEIYQLKQTIDTDDRKIDSLVNYLSNTNKVIILKDQFIITQSTMAACKKVIRNYLVKSNGARVSEIRDQLDSSRKYTIPILNYLDNVGFTYRDGEYRYLKE